MFRAVASFWITHANFKAILHPTSSYTFNIMVLARSMLKSSCLAGYQVSSGATCGGSMCSVALGNLLRGT